MKIKEINIPAYGPITDLLIMPGDFECIFGLNETGKTALVEVMTHSLFKRTAATLRYGKPKEATVTVAEDDKLYKLPAKKLDIALPPLDIAGLLYVQASDSVIFDENTGEKFWDRLKTMFTSIGKGITFARLDAKIFEAVKIQPKKLDWEKEKKQYIDQQKQRLQDLGECIKEIGVIEKEQKQYQILKKKQHELNSQIEDIEKYKRYKVFCELSKLYESYLADKVHLNDYERYKDEYFSTWQELSAKEKAGRHDEVQLSEVKKEIIELEKDMMELKRKEDFIAAEGLKECITRVQEKEKLPSFLYPLLIVAVSSILFILSFFTMIPRVPSFIIFILSLCIFAFFVYRRNTIKKAITTKDKWLKKAKRLYPDIINLKQLAERIEATERLKIEKNTLMTEKKKIEKRLARKQNLTAITRGISELRDKTGLAEIDDLKIKLNEKKKIEQSINEKFGKIYGILSEKDDRKWEQMITKMKTKKPAQEPDISSEKEIGDELQKVTSALNALEQKIEVFNRTLQTSFNIMDHRDAFITFNKIHKELEAYDIEKKAAVTARKILQEMSSELDEYIQNILKGSDSLTEYFKDITGKYVEVRIQHKNFAVVNKDGEVLHINELSSGTQDQLLLCFRIAALKKLYPGGCFLLLDDAFIFADWQRRNKLVGLLKKFTEDGNQVIYLTSDDHTRDLLRRYGAHILTL